MTRATATTLAPQRCIVMRCLTGYTPNLLQKRDALLCVVKLNTGQTLLVAFVHLFQYIVLCHDLGIPLIPTTDSER